MYEYLCWKALVFLNYESEACHGSKTSSMGIFLEDYLFPPPPVPSKRPPLLLNPPPPVPQIALPFCETPPPPRVPITFHVHALLDSSNQAYLVPGAFPITGFPSSGHDQIKFYFYASTDSCRPTDLGTKEEQLSPRQLCPMF
jgi:hypothetical protein